MFTDCFVTKPRVERSYYLLPAPLSSDHDLGFLGCCSLRYKTHEIVRVVCSYKNLFFLFFDDFNEVTLCASRHTTKNTSR